MKRIKKVLLLLIIILLSGCSVEYDLTINDDSSVNEKVIAKEVTNRMKANTGISEEQSIDYLYEMFNRKNLKTNISTKKEGSTTISTVTGNHKSLKKYVDNFTSDVFEDVNYSKEGNLVTLTFDQSKKLSSTATRGLVYDDITVKIKVPFKVIEHNAKTFNKDTYTWEIRKDEDLKQIKITYDESNLINSKEFTIGNIKFNVKYSFLIAGIIIFFALGIIVFVYINNKKNNKI